MTDVSWAIALLAASGLVAASSVGYVVVRWVGLHVARLRADWRARRDTGRRLKELGR